jgi:thioredoxin 1
MNCKIKTMILDVTGKELKKEVAENTSLLLVHFKIEWNGACQILAPLYEDLAHVYKDTAKFFTIDADKNRTVMHEYGVMEIPAILFFKNGEVIDHVSGLASKNIIISKIENALTRTNN